MFVYITIAIVFGIALAVKVVKSKVAPATEGIYAARGNTPATFGQGIGIAVFIFIALAVAFANAFALCIH